MKQLIFFISLLFASSFLVTACDDSDNNVDTERAEDITLEVQPVSLNFAAEGGEQTISVSSNSNWTISFSSDSWVKPDISASKGNVDVKIVAEASDVEEERTVVLTISAGKDDNRKDIEVTVTQAARIPFDEPENGNENGDEPAEYIEPDASGMRDITAVEFSQLMTVGWNLGNSLEAINVVDGVYSGGETSWGNPVVTQQLIDSVAEAGFNTIRIPVSWSHKIVDETNYKISDSWLQRVGEVVNYALDNDMFVIINIHWDGGWMNHPFYDNQDEINNKLKALWKQIAIYFRDYDDRLLFAGSNEVHVEGNYGDPSTENVEVQNSFNQTFVNTVRATGGRNVYRYLVVQAYNTNISYAVNYMVMPSDEATNRLLAEVHFYDPYDFTLQTDGNYKTQWGEPFSGGDVSSWGQEDWVDEAFGMMKTNFVDEGYGVILGEYGAVLRSGLTGDELTQHIEARKYYLEYVTSAAIENYIVPIYWDNGYAGNNGFALFDRQSGEVVDPVALEAILSGAGISN
ncbi:MAG: endoglucanase [Anaerophaga sp.]|uniref:cellulase family glycosylhydrolase n=1 Tax=Anaerophaga thermohalophila TaxID=177400 RepID=UPI000237D5D0|nr:cellulase family glycosylhydrolase [Anaerophaga thermohalophila]MDN5291874.1 endoglucanase [Anaerophaga sp.]